MFKILLPSNNLGCFGISIDLYIFNLYADIFKLWNNEKYRYSGIYFSFNIPNKTSVNGYIFFNGFIKLTIWNIFNRSYKIRFKLYPVKYLIRSFDWITGNCIYKLTNYQKGKR